MQGKHLTALLTIAFVISAQATRVRADVVPRGGEPFPRAYYLRLQQDPRAFQFKRAFVQQAERLRVTRSSLMTRVTAMPADAAAREVVAAEAAIAVRGQREIPVVPMLHKNSPGKPFQESALETRLFGTQGNTMRNFYQENSYGLLQVSGRVNPFFQLPNNDTFYEGADFMDQGQLVPCNGLCPGAKLPDMLRASLTGLDATIDFRNLDNDGPDGTPNSDDDDGFVDFVAFVHPERGGECGRQQATDPPNRNIWSHRSAITSWGAAEFETNDVGANGARIKVDDYVIMPALNCDGQTMIHIGVFAHEFGHAFGLPDLYDTVQSNGVSQGIGNWCLMAAGSWGGDDNSPELPSHMSAWAKVFLGWLQPQLVTATRSVNLAPVYSARVAALKVPISSSQYYLIEYRNHTGFDAKLKGTGLLVWRINDTVINAGLATNRVNGDAANKGVDLVEADGRNQLDLATNNGGNRGDEGDPYPGSTKKVRLDATSNPRVQGSLSLCGISAPSATVSVQVRIGVNNCAS